MMAQGGKGLAVLALIIALIGAGGAGFLLAQQYLLVPPEEEPYLRPMAKVYRTGTYILSSGGTTTFNFTTLSYDSHDAFDLASDAYEIPETGFYHVIAQYCIEAEPSDFFKINNMLNGTIITSCSYTAAFTTNTFTVSVTDIINATAGDLISIQTYIYNSGGEPRQIFVNKAYTFFTIMKIT